MPPEYLSLYLCRDVYHCTPAELLAQDPRTILIHLTCLSVESDSRNKRHRH